MTNVVCQELFLYTVQHRNWLVCL